MAYSTPKTWVNGETVTDSMLNANIRDNMNELWQGTAIGSMDYYSSSTTKDELLIGTQSQVLKINSGIPTWGNPTGCRLQNHLSTFSVANNTPTTISTFSTEAYDSDGFHSGTTGTITIPTGLDGYYLIGCGGWWNPNADTYLREMGIIINGVILSKSSVGSINGETMWQTVTMTYPLYADDVINMTGTQKSGGALDLHQYQLWIAKVG